MTVLCKYHDNCDYILPTVYVDFVQQSNWYFLFVELCSVEKLIKMW